MRRPLLLLALTLLCSIASTAGSIATAIAEPACLCNGAEPCVCWLGAARPAPWDGYLFSPLAAQAVDAEARRLEERAEAEVQAERSRGLARIEAQQQFYRQREGKLLEELDRLRHPPWYRQPGFLLPTGALGGALLTAGLFVLLGGAG